MNIECPFGCTDKVTVGSLTLEFTDVNIYADVCDHSDLCKNELCKFCDLTKEGTRRFLEAMTHSKSSIEAIVADRRKGENFKKRLKYGIRVIQGGRR